MQWLQYRITYFFYLCLHSWWFWISLLIDWDSLKQFYGSNLFIIVIDMYLHLNNGVSFDIDWHSHIVDIVHFWENSLHQLFSQVIDDVIDHYWHLISERRMRHFYFCLRRVTLVYIAHVFALSNKMQLIYTSYNFFGYHL